MSALAASVRQENECSYGWIVGWLCQGWGTRLALMIGMVMWSGRSSAAAPGESLVATNLAQIAAIQRDPAQTTPIMARFTGTVVYTERPALVCVQSAKLGAIVQWPEGTVWPDRGDSVEVEAPVQFLRGGSEPVITASRAKKIGSGSLPDPIHPWLLDALNGEYGGRWLELEGVIMQTRREGERLLIHFTDESGWAVATVFGWREDLSLTNAWGARIRVRATNIGRGLQAVRVQRPEDVTVLHPGAASQFEAPLTKTEILRALPGPQRDRWRLRATVLEADDQIAYLRSGATAFRANYLQPFSAGAAVPHPSELIPGPIPKLELGDEVEVVGSPLQIKPFLTLSFCAFRKLGSKSGVPPARVPAHSILDGTAANDWVQISGRLLNRKEVTIHNVLMDQLQIEAEGITLEAISEARNRGHFPPVSRDDLIRINGLVTPATGEPPYLLRILRPEDVHVLYGAPSLARQRALRIVGLAGVLLVAAGGWIVLLRAQVRQRTAALASAKERLEESAEQLRESETKFRTLFESGSTAVALYDERGVIDCNPACLKIFGYGRAEFLGKGPADLAPPLQPNGESSERAARQHMAEASTKGRHQFEWLARRADGSPLPVEIVLTPVQLNGRTVLQALVHDITRHKRTEEKAYRSEAVTRSINYFATSLLERDSEDEVLWDLAQKCVSNLGFADCVVYLLDKKNDVLVQKAAYGPKNPAERHILNPITIPLGKGIVGTVAATGHPEIIADTRQDARYIIDDAQRLSELAVPIVANHEVLGVIDSEHPELNFFTQEQLQILTSIASLCANKLVRVRAEQRLRALNVELERRVAERTQELATANAQLKQAEQELLKSLAQEKELNELKTRFVSMVSHEFRTPLAIIMSSAEILDAYLDRLSPQERAANLKDIAEATRHMGVMVEEVLVLSRVEAGKLTFRPCALDVTELAERLIDEVLSATNRRCPIELQCRLNLRRGYGDEALLRHVLTNLLQNAVKYSPPGVPVEFHIETQGPNALFTIRDHGIGIPESDVRQLFTAFHRGSNVGDTPGTGLGMVIVKSCVELHQGMLTFETQEDRGTTFRVLLPLFQVIPSDPTHPQTTMADPPPLSQIP